jgi:hypothetical protein
MAAVFHPPVAVITDSDTPTRRSSLAALRRASFIMPRLGARRAHVFAQAGRDAGSLPGFAKVVDRMPYSVLVCTREHALLWLWSAKTQEAVFQIDVTLLHSEDLEAVASFSRFGILLIAKRFSPYRILANYRFEKHSRCRRQWEVLPMGLHLEF